MFSYAFYFRGYTGLTITIASIVTLAVLMHVTARVDRSTKFEPEAAVEQPEPGNADDEPAPASE
ncbi:MAG: hypothetical protein U9R79_08910 [Armatimonadota bacterium]|nr:hypothetical protein [Armatimonadota bacterium]